MIARLKSLKSHQGFMKYFKNIIIENAHITVTEPNFKVKIGEDCMFAYDIDIRTGDSHSIIDKNSGKRINYAQDISIGNHVWLASHCRILKGVTTKRPKMQSNPENDPQTHLYLPDSEMRQGEGGLRTKGYFKKSYPNKPLVTVITIVYNGESYLEETIQSVTNQSYDNVEYIIIDGGSTDNTLNIIKKFEEQIDYWVSEKDAGIYDAMNKGIYLASGEWINFMNGGDLFFNLNTIQQIVPHLTSDLVYGNHAIYKDNPFDAIVYDVKNNSGVKHIPFCHQALFEKSEWLKRDPFDTQYKIAADYHHYLLCKNKMAKIKHVPLTVTRFLDGGFSVASRKELIKEYYQVTKKYFKFSSRYLYVFRMITFYILGR